MKQIFSTNYAFAALKEDGSVVTWGRKDSGGDSSKVSSLLNGNNKIVQIFSTGSAFAALREDGSVVSWGSSDGGDSSSVANKLNGDIDVVNIYSNAGFAALRIDGSVVTWGQSEMSNSSKVANQLDGTIDVIQIATTQTAFAAIRIDGSVVTWGYGPDGGDSSAVATQLSSGVVSFANASTDDVYLASSGVSKVNHLPTGIVSVNGTAKTGQTLTASNTLTDADGLGLMSYQWLRSGSVISGANQSSYTLTSNDLNATISVKASYTDSFGTQESVYSSSTASIISSNNAPTGFATGSLTNGTKNTSYILYTSTMLQGFSDADGDVLTVTNLSATNGSISNNGNNTWTLTPSTNYVGTISLNYSVTDTKSTPISASLSLSFIENQVPPTGTVSISGTSQQYQTLYASNTLADANGLGTINYQWLSNGNIISGANLTSYALTQTDVGKAISVRASYTDGLGKLESMTSSATNSVINVNDLPKGSVYINGKPNQAQVLTASNDISDLDGLGAINYQWLRSGSLINGANQSSYTLTANDVNSSISVKASYTDSYGTTESVTSSGITAQPPLQTPPTGSVFINGTSQQNQTLIASQNLADINGLGTINYEWLRNENIISGATQISYTLTQADVGKAITVRTSYTDGLGKLESVTSSPTSPVVNVNDLSTGSVTISGEAKQGRTLTASHNLVDADGLGTISYQWLRNGEIISNANNSSYTLTQIDADKAISVKAFYIDVLGTTENVSSSGLIVAASNILNVNSPTINEGDTGQSSLTFTLTLSPAVQQSTSVDYTSQSGTATAGADFTTASGTVQFNASETSKTIVVSVLGDTAIENDETFNLVLSNPRILEFSNASSTLTALGTIRNDDFPTLSLSGPQSVKEGNTGQTALNYTAKLSQAAPFDISVDYATQGITAIAGQDFTSQSGTFKFAAGTTEKTISIPVLGDTTDEPDETLSFVLSNPQNAKFANNVNELRSAGTILNDDSQTVRVNSPSVIEGDSGITYLKFLVSLGYTVNSDVTFDYKIEDGTATLNTDYAVTTNTVNLSAGQQSTEINIPISGDTRIEPNETLKLTINSAKGITLPVNTLPISSIGTLINDDLPLVSVLAAKTTYEPAIGFKNVDIPVTLSATASTDVIISYHTEGATATQDKDFLNSSAKLTIPANANTGIISVPINADSEKEPDETFKVIIDKVEGGAKLSTGQNSVTSEVTISAISLPVFAVQDVALQEGDSGNKNLMFKVNLSAASTLPVTFSVKTVDKTATAGQDYLELKSVTKTIPVGSQSLEITLATVGDKVSESDETFNLVFSNITNAVFDNGNETFSATGTIIDDDKPIIRIDDVHILEGDQGFHTENIKVTLSMTAANPVKVHYALLDGTAKGGEDFVTSEDDLIIPAGAKEAYISVAIQGDKIPEAAQDFHIQLSNPSNAQFLDLALTTQNTVTIDSDDGDTLPILSVGKNLAVDEGDTGLTSFPIILTLSKPATDTLSIKYQTLSIDAKVGSDFISTSGTLTFLAGDISKAINISVFSDTEVESDEDFTLSLTDPLGMRFSNGFPTQDLTLLIRDDDAEPPQTLQGTAKNDILDATKTGGTGDDTLDGLKGIDTMIGGDGNDTYFVDNIKDAITEGEQSQSNAGDDDLVHSVAASYILPANVEHLVIDGKLKGNGTGNVLDNRLIGNLAVNVLSGLAGNDTLDGGSGNDTLTGGDGNDMFMFSQGIKGNKNIDTVKDFVHGQDKIYLSADIFSKLAVALGFASGNEPMSLAKADSHYLVSAVKVKVADASSYLLYNTATGRLSYDEDGSDKLVASSFVTLTGKPTLTLDDFWIS